MPLQKQFIGLSDWLGEFEGGSIKFERGLFIQPVFQVDDFIAPPITDTDTRVITGNIGDNAPNFVVPDGEVWRLRYFGSSIGIGAAWVQSRFGLEWFDAGSGTATALSSSGINWPTLASAREWVHIAPPGLYMRAGDILQTTVLNGGGAGNGTATAICQYQKIKI